MLELELINIYILPTFFSWKVNSLIWNLTLWAKVKTKLLLSLKYCTYRKLVKFTNFFYKRLLEIRNNKNVWLHVVKKTKIRLKIKKELGFKREVAMGYLLFYRKTWAKNLRLRKTVAGERGLNNRNILLSHSLAHS